jgi:hypothetical protein
MSQRDPVERTVRPSPKEGFAAALVDERQRLAEDIAWLVVRHHRQPVPAPAEPSVGDTHFDAPAGTGAGGL